jgi:hypothetical protein
MFRVSVRTDGRTDRPAIATARPGRQTNAAMPLLPSCDRLAAAMPPMPQDNTPARAIVLEI